MGKADGKASTKVLAVVGRDLFIPIVVHVFGEAQLNGDLSVVSYSRHLNGRHGLPPDPAVEFHRLLKKIITKLGVRLTESAVSLRIVPCGVDLY